VAKSKTVYVNGQPVVVQVYRRWRRRDGVIFPAYPEAADRPADANEEVYEAIGDGVSVVWPVEDDVLTRWEEEKRTAAA